MKTLIAIPCMDTVHTQFMQSVLSMRKTGDVDFSCSSSSLIYDARNGLVTQAIQGGYDRIMWLDSDMVFPPDTMERLAADLDEGYQFVSGIYYKRRPPFHPVIYKTAGFGKNPKDETELIPIAEEFLEYPEDSVFPVQGCGFGCCMMDVTMAKLMVVKYGLLFSPLLGFGEDLSFCIRATQQGMQLYCDSRIKAAHIGNILVNEATYKATNGGK